MDFQIVDSIPSYILCEDDIDELLKNFEKVDDIFNINLGHRIIYFTVENKQIVFKQGGYVMNSDKNNDTVKYHYHHKIHTLKNTKSCIFYKEKTIIEIIKEYEEIINDYEEEILRLKNENMKLRNIEKIKTKSHKMPMKTTKIIDYITYKKKK